MTSEQRLRDFGVALSRCEHTERWMACDVKMPEPWSTVWMLFPSGEVKKGFYDPEDQRFRYQRYARTVAGLRAPVCSPQPVGWCKGGDGGLPPAVDYTPPEVVPERRPDDPVRDADDLQLEEAVDGLVSRFGGDLPADQRAVVARTICRHLGGGRRRPAADWWQPMSTAPKDGEKVLLLTPNVWYPVQMGYWTRQPSWNRWEDGQWRSIEGWALTPLQWRPLPAVPKDYRP